MKFKTQIFKLVVFLVIILFFINMILFFNNQFILSFDTLRELSYIESSLNSKSIDKPSEWGLSVIIHSLDLITGLNSSYLVLFFGYFIFLLTGLFLFMIIQRIENRTIASLVLPFFLLSSLLIFNAQNFRPEIFSYLMQYLFVFLFILSFSSKKFQSLFLIFIPFIFLVNTHKTGIFLTLFIFLAMIFHFLYYFSQNRLSKIKSYFFYLIVLLIFASKTFLEYLSFYFGAGKTISPAGFSIPLEPYLGFIDIFGVGIFILLILGFFLFLKIKSFDISKKNLYVYSFILVITLFYYTLIVFLPRMGISILPTRFYNYLFLYILLFLPFVIVNSKKVINKKLLIFIIFISLAIIIPLYESNTMRVTASPSYLEEINKIAFEKNDTIITTFTSSPAFLVKIFSNESLRYNTNVISGYNFWGEDIEATKLVRDIYYSHSENQLNSNICLTLNYYKNYIEEIPEASEFLVSSIEERKSLAESINYNEVYIIYPKFDLNSREFSASETEEKVNWWKYRSIYDADYEELFSLQGFSKIYSSNNLEIYKFKINCIEDETK